VGKLKSIYVTGFMGAGKTTIGQLVGKLLELPVYDSDQEIEKEQKKTISTIFSELGEEAFRDMETNILKRLPRENAIITTGGGLILREENRLWLQSGTYIYLHCDSAEISKRLLKDETRPLLSGERKHELESLFQKRLPLYEKAQIIIDTTSMSPLEAAEEILRRINS